MKNKKQILEFWLTKTQHHCYKIIATLKQKPNSHKFPLLRDRAFFLIKAVLSEAEN